MIKKLYDKNELWVALGFIFLYCITNIPIRGKFGDSSIYMMISNIIITLLLVIFIKKYKLEEKYGLNQMPKNIKKYLYFMPMLILATVNFWGGFGVSYKGAELVYASISMLLIGFIEEVIFRGLLLKAVEKNKGLKKAIIISAITFGIGHILNFVSQTNLETFMQVIYAIAFGFMFVFVFIKSKSLWPCIILHSIVDLTSKYGAQNINIYVITIVVSVICILYSIYLSKIDSQKV